MGQLAAYDDFRSGYYQSRRKTEKELVCSSLTKTLDVSKEISYKKVITYLESISILESSEELFLLHSLAEDILLDLKSQGYHEIAE